MECTCPLCGREMTTIETYPGRGELYCGSCDLTIGGNRAMTPDELCERVAMRPTAGNRGGRMTDECRPRPSRPRAQGRRSKGGWS